MSRLKGHCGAAIGASVWLLGKSYNAFLINLLVGMGDKSRKQRLAPHLPELLDQAGQESVNKVGWVSIKVFNVFIKFYVALFLRMTKKATTWVDRLRKTTLRRDWLAIRIRIGDVDGYV